MVEGHRCAARDNLIVVNTDIGLFTGQGHAAEGVAANQAGDCNIGIKSFCVSPCRTLRLAVVDIGLRLGRDGQRSLFDGQGTGVDADYQVVSGHVSGHIDLHAGEGVGVGARVGTAHRGGDGIGEHQARNARIEAGQ